MVSLVLTAIGLLLLVISFAGVALGLYMAADMRTRRRGQLVTMLWVPAMAASSGILMRDVVTFAVGLICFLVAGTVFVLQRRHARRATSPQKGRLGQMPRGKQ